MTIAEPAARPVPPEIASLLQAWVKKRGLHIFISARQIRDSLG